jgi:PKHD-type hydroxylase
VALAEPECAEVGSIEGDDEVDRVRSSSVSWLGRRRRHLVDLRAARSAVREANEGWGFDLVGFEEELQYTRYDGPGDHYTWHRDGLDGDVSTRKITVVVQLTDPGGYDGAQLEVARSPGGSGRPGPVAARQRAGLGGGVPRV